MTFEKAVKEIAKKFLKKAKVENFNAEICLLDDDCGGVFSIRVSDGKVDVVPYDYYECDVHIDCTYENFNKFISGEKSTYSLDCRSSRFADILATVKKSTKKDEKTEESEKAEKKPATKKEEKAEKSVKTDAKKTTAKATTKKTTTKKTTVKKAEEVEKAAEPVKAESKTAEPEKVEVKAEVKTAEVKPTEDKAEVKTTVKKTASKKEAKTKK